MTFTTFARTLSFNYTRTKLYLHAGKTSTIVQLLKCLQRYGTGKVLAAASTNVAAYVLAAKAIAEGALENIYLIGSCSKIQIQDGRLSE